MPWSKRRWNASHQATAIIAASAASWRKRCRVSGSIRSDRAHRYGRGARRDHALLRLGGDPRPERQREVLARGALGLRQIAFAPSERAQRRLEVERRQVVLGARDAGLGERGADAVALWRPAHEEVVDVARLVGRKLTVLGQAELGVARGGLAAEPRPLVETRQEDAQDGRL